MFPRQAAIFLKRIRFSSKDVCYTGRTITNALPISISSKMKTSYQYGSGSGAYSSSTTWDPHLWIAISGSVAIVLGINANPVSAREISEVSSSDNDRQGADLIGLLKIEDGSVVSNTHTSKWRIFTDKGNDLFLQGKLDEAEKLFLSAVQEAKEGFGEKDPHVASACNNLAELYRVKRAFNKAEPLYLDAISILEQSFGPEDIRMAAAYHNLGQLYVLQRKFEEARVYYEIKGCVLGYGHADYADTMYHLGTVLSLQGKGRDAESLIQESIRILEEGGQGNSFKCIRRLRNLSQIYKKSGCVAEAEIIQRKILHILELSKGWHSLDTVIAAEWLALTLQSLGNFKEAQELLERCLDSLKIVVPKDHIQIGVDMLRLARVEMLNTAELRKTDISGANAELEKAKYHLYNSTRIAHGYLDKFIKQKGNLKNSGAFRTSSDEARAAMIILLQSLDAVGNLEIIRQGLYESLQEKYVLAVEVEKALFQCISAYKEFGTVKLISDAPEVKVEYLSCLKNLSSLIMDNIADKTTLSREANWQEVKTEIKRLEDEIASHKKIINSKLV
ncbi:Kinesin light chain 3 [Quillaja saponaria]|uniref:Kinesin light chain 3 n=1 Tax=Quillaja saponaria TaxID=32244 RepID=A0AAD7LLI4_QUISA|nr:Kinesin light chain 3 [Quillaja saponaria]